MEKNVPNVIRDLRRAIDETKRRRLTVERDHSLMKSEVERQESELADKKAEFRKLDDELKRLTAEQNRDELALRNLEQEINLGRHNI
ncbi:MAG: hypothetical protein A3D52_02785 [Candidatus Taylorbacteria bacterium RIFCSPHIGHO2_02_FULL_44_36]|uniref:Uncharacterized protein n=1 Tax=Candidatus Taylorbacteria bacterium RIFCSPLOWO2_12_FULL_44_15c TaxID=1802333 RepID=A0A1G2P405_9BACT|nr:MAG: hypothetical protein A3D52_02785 [Candidatus Taylorbacteria bacterium RIFCSPHIGHO2_02_FULL_44_36]OHA43087.1 MAG: hypothetical protein A3G03_02230 [Candidatus Taylorbacteria bacterium RIFCSPLOWO2_12_FULL_44_15c]